MHLPHLLMYVDSFKPIAVCYIIMIHLLLLRVYKFMATALQPDFSAFTCFSIMGVHEVTQLFLMVVCNFSIFLYSYIYVYTLASNFIIHNIPAQACKDMGISQRQYWCHKVQRASPGTSSQSSFSSIHWLIAYWKICKLPLVNLKQKIHVKLCSIHGIISGNNFENKR